MTGLWRQVLSALNQPDARPDREQLLALGAAELAHARRTGTEPVTAEEVQRIALTEFSLLLDVAGARVALSQRQRRAARG
ncbi:hypothetical protein [Streptomyces sp. NPDC057910]|uniref:hypothetical protein n=1 Tax=Streptomyces sp. NPDC057910 TaxID=3346278 RepID=UPI0036EB0FDE